MKTPALDEIAAWQWPRWAVLSRRPWTRGEYDSAVTHLDWTRELHGIPGAL